MSVIDAVHTLVDQRPEHRIVSLYLDLDPERFATPPARVSEINSLLDEANRAVERDDSLDHDEHVALRQDLERIRSYLLSERPPFRGARALGVFSSIRDDLFEVVQLPYSVEGRVTIERTAYVEPLLKAARQRRWCAVLLNRREARILTGAGDTVRERARARDDVHGQHDQGGWSQANYERSYEKETDDHLRRVVEDLEQAFRREGFDRLALGGPVEIVPRFEAALSEQLRELVVQDRVDLDVSSATEQQIREAMAPIVAEDQRKRQRELLDRLAERLGSGGRAAAGPEAVLTALNERRVEALLLEPGFQRRGTRCPSCGLLAVGDESRCAVDGAQLESVDFREAAIEAAVMQDAEIVVVADYPDLGPFQGIATLLRF